MVEVGVVVPFRSGRLSWCGALVAVLIVAVLLPVAVVLAPAPAFATPGDLTLSPGSLAYFSESPSGARMVATVYEPGVAKRLAVLDTASNEWSQVSFPSGAMPDSGSSVYAMVNDSGSTIVAVYSSGGVRRAYQFVEGSWSSGAVTGVPSTESVSAVDVTGSKVFVVGSGGTLAEATWSGSASTGGWSTRSMSLDSIDVSTSSLSVIGGAALFVRSKSSGTGLAVSRLELSSGATSKVMLTPESGGFADAVVSVGPGGGPVITATNEGMVLAWTWTGSVWDRKAELVPAELVYPRAAAVGSDGRLHVVGETKPGLFGDSDGMLASVSADLGSLRSWSGIYQLDANVRAVEAISTPSAGASRPVGVVVSVTSGGGSTNGWRGTRTAQAMPTTSEALTAGTDHKVADIDEPSSTPEGLVVSLSGNGQHAALRLVDGAGKVLVTSDASGQQWTLAEDVPSSNPYDKAQYVGIENDGSVLGVGSQCCPGTGGWSRWFRMDRAGRRWVGGRKQLSPDGSDPWGAQILSGASTHVVFNGGYVNKLSTASELTGTRFSGSIDGPSATDGEFIYSIKGSQVRKVPADVPTSAAQVLVSAGASLSDGSLWAPGGGSVFAAGKVSAGILLKSSSDQGATWTVVDPGSSPSFPSGTTGGPVLGWSGTSQLVAYATATSGLETVIYRSVRPLTGTGGWSTPEEVGRVPLGAVKLAVASGPGGAGLAAGTPGVFAKVTNSNGDGGLYQFGTLVTRCRPMQDLGCVSINRVSTQGLAGDPVNVATGSLQENETDLPAPESGSADARLSRFYNSLGGVAGQFGPGWTSSFDERIMLAPAEARELQLADGETILYASDGSGGWTAPSTFRAPLTWNASTKRYTLKRPDGTTRTYDEAGWLISSVNALGASTTYTRTAAGYLSSVTSGGYTITFTDDHKITAAGATVAGSDGLADKAVTSEGRVVRYGYTRDLVSDETVLASVSVPHSPAQDAASTRTYGQRRYETSGNTIVGIFDETAVGAEHQFLANTLDAQGRVATQVSDDGDTAVFHYGKRPGDWGGGYGGALVDAEGYTTVDHSSSGDRTVYQYDTDGVLAATWDAFGKPLQRTWVDLAPDTSTSRSGIVSEASYDTAGRITGVTETIGGVTRTKSASTYLTAASSSGAAQDDRLATSTDAAGVMTTYGYASSTSPLPDSVSVPCGALATGVSCPSGGKVTTAITYDSTFPDLVASQTDPDGVKTEFTYWPDRSLKTEKTFPNGTTPSTTSYAYLYPSSVGWAETDPRIAKVVTVTAPGTGGSRVTATRYDAEGRVLEVRDPLYDGTTHKATRYQYSASGDLESVTDPADHTTTYATYRPDSSGSWPTGAPTGVPAGVVRIEASTDPDGITDWTLYDRSGDAVGEWRGKASAPSKIAKTTSTYGALARLLTTVDPMGVKTWYAYDDEGRVMSTTTGPSATDTAHRITTDYDDWGNTEWETGPVESDPSSVGFQSKTTFTYDSAGRVRTKIDTKASGAGDALMTSYVYDDAGRLYRTIEHRNGDIDTSHWQTIAAGDKVSETRYTRAGRTRQSVEPGADDPNFDWTSADSAKRITTFGYDDAGRQTSVTDPRNKTTNTTYTAAGEVDTVTTPAGRVTDYDYDALGRSTKITTPSGLPAGQPATVSQTKTYWPGGELKTDTDPHVVVSGVTDPSTRSFHYTPGGRLDDVTDALGRHVTYDYDERGNRTSRTSKNDSGTDVVESWTWDLNDNMKSHTVPAPRSGASPMSTSYAYDYDDTTGANDYGNLVSVTDPTGRVETRDYYGSGTIKSRTWTKTGATTQSSSVWLDARGFTTKMRDTTGTTNRDTTYIVDRAGQRTKATTAVGSIDYTWDLAGNLREMTQPDGSKFRYTHRPTGELYEFLGWSTGSSTWGLITNYTYNDDGIQTGEWIYSAGGSSRTYTLDAAGRTSTFTQAMKKPDSTWENYTAALGHRADGRLGTEQVNGGTTATSSYDNAGQLTAQSGTAPVSYSYGTRGNRLTSTASSATTTYTTNPNGSVATATTGSTVTTYTYDDAGRRTQAETKVSGTTTRTVATSYDARGKPATITDTAGSATITETRTYDGNSQLTANTITGGDSPGTYQMVWDTTVAVPRLSETRKNGTTWVRSDYGNELLSFKTGAYPKWYKLDARNSIINPDNNTNNATGPTAYDPYGTPTGATYYTTGYRSELHLGNLIHLRNRDYDPATGQFTTQDELDGIDGTPSVANAYHYSLNDPYNISDPLGLRGGEPDESVRETTEQRIQEKIDEVAVKERALAAAGGYRHHTAGVCIDGSLTVGATAFGFSGSLAGCFLIDPSSYYLLASWPADLGIGLATFQSFNSFKDFLKLRNVFAASATVGYFLSNAPQAKDIEGYSVCGSAFGGDFWGAELTVCLGTKKKFMLSDEEYPTLTRKWSVYGGVGLGISLSGGLLSADTSVKRLRSRFKLPIVHTDPVCEPLFGLLPFGGAMCPAFG